MFNLENIKQAAEKLGLFLKEGAENPGINFVKDGELIKHVSFTEVKKDYENEFNNSNFEYQLSFDLTSNFRLDFENNLDKVVESTQKYEIAFEFMNTKSFIVNEFEMEPWIEDLTGYTYTHSNGEAA